MMISPESFYVEVKDKSPVEIEKEIRKLKRSIARLKKDIENPGGERDKICPSRSTVIYWSREYLGMAKRALSETGGEYHETQEEQRAHLFLENLPNLRRMELEICNFMRWDKYVIEIEGDTVKHFPKLESHIVEEQVETREELLNRLRDVHLEEWKKTYSPKPYGMYILDGTQWDLKLEYSDGIRPVKYEGDNVFPWNFEELCALFGVDWARYGERDD